MIVETDRLILRPPVKEDFAPFAEFQGDAEMTRFLGGPQAPPLAWRFFTSIAGSWALYGFGMFSVIERTTGRWIGRLGPWRPEGWPGNEIAYSLVKSATGKGYASEGVTATIDFAFRELGWTEVIHCISPDNVPSQKVAERVGSVNRGPGKLPAPMDQMRVDIWGQTRDRERNADSRLL